MMHVSVHYNAHSMCSIKYSVHFNYDKKYMIRNIMIKIISVSFRNRFENLHVLTIPKETYLLIATDMEPTFSLKTSTCNFKIERQALLIHFY